jgi:hypothetical protein
VAVVTAESTAAVLLELLEQAALALSLSGISHPRNPFTSLTLLPSGLPLSASQAWIIWWLLVVEVAALT